MSYHPPSLSPFQPYVGLCSSINMTGMLCLGTSYELLFCRNALLPGTHLASSLTFLNFAQNITFSVKSILTTLLKITMCLLPTPTAPSSLLRYLLISHVYCLLSVYPLLDDELHEGKDFLLHNSKDASLKQCQKYRGREHSMCSVSRYWMKEWIRICIKQPWKDILKTN